MDSIENINLFIISAVADIKSIPKETIRMDNHILYDLYLDSVDLIDLLTLVEDELKVVIKDDELEKVTTLSSIANIIHQH